jgi:type II secretory pathway pseudopilin PulG
MKIKMPKPLRGWREFWGEVGIIVLGVLIALAAQQLVENIHQGQETRRAEAALRLELSQNDGPQAYARVLISKCLDQQIARIHDDAEKIPAKELRQWTVAYAPPFRTWDSEAWRVVVASDIGTNMGADRLVAWSSPYRMMPSLSEANAREGQLVVDLREAVPTTSVASTSDLQRLREIAGQLRLLNRRFAVGSELLLARIGALDAQVPERIRRDLISNAREIYGGCVATPDLNTPPQAQRVSAMVRSPVLDQ